ncbi:hypothetical protein OF83DRAFT_61721 [Amylostereum chailletii]|nr:hypothetical protein OF83DRAFT_61721 [Amylostereum chailletii]
MDPSPTVAIVKVRKERPSSGCDPYEANNCVEPVARDEPRKRTKIYSDSPTWFAPGGALESQTSETQWYATHVEPTSDLDQLEDPFKQHVAGNEDGEERASAVEASNIGDRCVASSAETVGLIGVGDNKDNNRVGGNDEVLSDQEMKDRVCAEIKSGPGGSLSVFCLHFSAHTASTQCPMIFTALSEDWRPLTPLTMTRRHIWCLISAVFTLCIDLGIRAQLLPSFWNKHHGHFVRSERTENGSHSTAT